MKAIKLADGMWFAVPVGKGGYALGLIARHSQSIMLNYFFGPIRKTVPTLQDVAGLKAGDAVLVTKVGARGLRQGEWPVLGRVKDWNAEAWPIPTFQRYSDSLDTWYRVSYPDDDINGTPSEVVTSSDEGRPSDSLHGYMSAVALLERLLTDPSRGSGAKAPRTPKPPQLVSAREEVAPKKRERQVKQRPEQALILKLKRVEPSSLSALEDSLESRLSAATGEFDGDEVAVDGSAATLFFYGPSADKLWKAIEAGVRTTPICRGATVLLRYGPPEEGAREKAIALE